MQKIIKQSILISLISFNFVGCMTQEPKTIGEIVEEKAIKTWDNTKDYTAEKYEDTKDIVVDFSSEKYEDSKEYVKENYQNSKGWVADKYEEVKKDL